MAGKKNAPSVTEQVFDTIKFMVKGGATINNCCAATGLCPATVSYIKRAKSYEEYKRILTEINDKKKAKKKAEAQPKEDVKPETPAPAHVEEKPTQIIDYRITLVANQYMAEQLKKQTELLELINNKLALIAEDLGCFREDKPKTAQEG